ncbi:dentin sialophosphoprotein-like [Ostrea edulis]|uniref:dentin sialophosphoprotein-like n=1 Tax=Ostrea edulis TaxID=37623 RepID=UPI0024AF7B16|nr:dentin sialophosphoprotein-like [Ostrea edulis]
MNLNSQDGARRKLKFTSSSQTVYYLDISSCKLRVKTVQRILSLHGKIEEFLSKEVNLVLTDRDAICTEEEEIPSNTDVKQRTMPLSRGRALLMKAAKQKNLPNDPVRYAQTLGVNIQKVSTFLKDTEFVKEKRSWNRRGEMNGIQPLSWSEKDNCPVVRSKKANCPIVKCEDIKKNYKPLIKLFHAFPQARYDSELISPFDKTIMLCRKSKENVNRYAVPRQSVQVSNKAVYCEACDCWFKCSLRQHLHSEKHLIFTRNPTNYRALDEIMEKVPPLEMFIKKFSLVEGTSDDTTIKENSSYPESLLVVSTPEEEMSQNKETKLYVFDSCSAGKTFIKTTVNFTKKTKTICNECGFETESNSKEDLSVRLNCKSSVKDTTNQQSPIKDTASQQSADTANQQSADTTNQQSADTTNQQSADTTNQQSADTTSQQSADTTNQQSAVKDTTNQLSADTTSVQSADTTIQQSAVKDTTNQQSAVKDTTNQQSAVKDTTNQQSADTISLQSAKTTNQQSADTTSLQSADTINQQSADTTNQQSAVKDTTNQQSADTTNQQSADTTSLQSADTTNQQSAVKDTTNQQSADTTNQQSADTTNQQSADTTNQQSAIKDTTNQQSADTTNQQSAVKDTTNQQSADTTNQQSADTTNQQSADTTSQQSAIKDTTNQQSADTTSLQSANTTNQQSAVKDTTNQQSADTANQQSADTNNQQSADTTNQQSADTTSVQSADTTNQQSAVKDTTNQQSADTTNQQSTDTTNQQSADATNQQSADTTNQQSADTTSQQSAVKDTTNQQSADTTNQQSAVKDTTSQQSADTASQQSQDTTNQQSADATNQQSAVKDTTNQQSAVKDTTNQQSVVKGTVTQRSPVKDTTNQQTAVKDTATQRSPVKDTTNQQTAIKDTTNQRLPLSSIANQDSLVRNPTNQGVLEHKTSECEGTTSQRQDNKSSKRIQSDIYFSPIHSPNYMPDYLSFADLANRWMADIRSACAAKHAKRETFKAISVQEQHVTVSAWENILENESKSVSVADCEKSILNTDIVNVSSVVSISHLTTSSVSLVQHVNKVDVASNTDIPYKHHEKLLNKKPIILSDVSKENIYGPITNKIPRSDVHPKAPVSRKLSYSPCVSNSDSIPPLSVTSEDKENQSTIPYYPEPVQQPIKIKIHLNSLKDTPDVQLVRSHRKRGKLLRGTSSSVYCAVQQSDMKLKLCKVKVTPVQQNGDLRHYWKVRKSGGCRLVFSAEKRKASDDGNDTPLASKRKRIDVM